MRTLIVSAVLLVAGCWVLARVAGDHLGVAMSSLPSPDMGMPDGWYFGAGLGLICLLVLTVPLLVAEFFIFRSENEFSPVW